MSNLETRAVELVYYVDLLVERFILVQELGSESLERLSKQELKVIVFVGKNEPCIMRQLADHMHLVSSAITAIVNKLVKKGLLKRFRTESDRRLVKVELTEAGREVFQIEAEKFLNLSRGILCLLDEDEQDQLLVLFRKISAQIDSLD